MYIRGVSKDFELIEEFLDLISLKDTTTGEDIFNAIDHTISEKGLSWEKLVSVTTDGAPALVG